MLYELIFRYSNSIDNLTLQNLKEMFCSEGEGYSDEEEDIEDDEGESGDISEGEKKKRQDTRDKKKESIDIDDVSEYSDDYEN